ncbi:MAG: pantoate--beta-alanine ligase [Calditrichia bacterium]
MKIIQTVEEMQQLSLSLKKEGKKIGFVPTMGYLHDGHLSLMKTARPLCDVLVVSIFVNPTQFGPHEDLDKYPRDFERDEQLCRDQHVDIIFYPDTKTMYPQPYKTYVEVTDLTDYLCGASRPGHFRGVTTVVAKLFNIILPDIAVFGRKDFQQAQIIKQMVRDLNFPVDIILAPIVRETDGLAMSSRNAYLSEEQRQYALVLYQSLSLAKELILQGERSARLIFKTIKDKIDSVPSKIDYISIVNAENFEPTDVIQDNTLIALAVFIGNTRLIDNMYIERLDKEDQWL